MNQEQKPLVEALEKFKTNSPVSFHVPGHKNGLIGQAAFLQAAGQFDMTELSTLDDLHAPEGAIKESMELLRSHYQSAASYFLVNGSTVGNLTMLLACCNPGDTVLIASNSHKSIMNACSLSGVKPVFLEPEVHFETSTASGLSAKVLQQACMKYREAKALVITYPSYYGHTIDIEGLIQAAKANRLLVLVDEAHGAHLTLGAPFPQSALLAGADLVVHSAHKTLPALTMGSYLHIGKEAAIDQKKVERVLSMLQSSSPSYLIMASLDEARAFLAGYTQDDISWFTAERDWFLSELEAIEGVRVIEAEDPLKLMIRVRSLTGYELQQKLEERFIYPELADPLQVLLILPLLKKGISYQDAFKRMILALKEISRDVKSGVKDLPVYEVARGEPVKELSMPAAEAENAQAEWVKLENAEGKIAAASIIPYPPGIPFIIAGERLTNDKIIRLLHWAGRHLRFQGEQRIDSGEIKIVKDFGGTT
ncbi:aminotransferase class I/II-fold pyridoxal phosphate-dependent enzyme [Jeotgalibacillus proteolyticus]|uniref:Lysine decarboxylase n=1 Tax=Jeotgalibacillus proteolyticus TaxID=2082395 RepID=A0A2S5G676_9BACL|nr:aminotransferase class I/II-fold pyridoxal phosphate-dependent enzyme [Jeotgalibacillus proteolyticus]PPA68508.1 lysine decarboxylase [Jeotgalibacillus proteolyticus]